MEEKHSYGAMVVFKEQLKVSRMSKKELKEYAEAKGVEAKGVRMLEQLGTLALVEAYDRLYEEHKNPTKGATMEEKHSYGAMIIFKEQLRVSRMDKKEAKEYAEAKGVEAKGVRMLEQLGTLALVEAYDRLYEEHKNPTKGATMEEKHSYGAMIIFKEQLRVSRMDKKEAKEYAEAKGVEAKGVRMLEQLGTLALVEAYDRLYEEHKKCKELNPQLKELENDNK